MPRKGICVCYYVSGHGLGHAARAVSVINALPPGIAVVVTSTAPAAFFHREITRPFELRPLAFDSGATQPDNFTVDWPASLHAAREIQEQVYRRAQTEMAFLRRRAAVVVSDICPAPLSLAREAGVPSACVANFTWIEPFAAGLKDKDRGARALLEDYRLAYSRATLLLQTPLSFPMPYFPHRREIPLIAPRGKRTRRAELARETGAGKRPIVLIYLGVWGGMDAGLAKLQAVDQYRFVAFQPMGPGVTVLNPGRWSFADAVACADAVVAKAGYGTAACCMVNGTPVVTYPRTEFAEYRVLRSGLDQWGGVVGMSRRGLLAGRWNHALDQAIQLHPRRHNSSGAQAAAKAIMELACARRWGKSHSQG